MDIETKLKELLHGIDEDIDVDAITLDSNLMEDIGMSSVALLYMSVALEDEFGIDFNEIDMKETKTAGDVVALIEKKLQQNQ